MKKIDIGKKFWVKMKNMLLKIYFFLLRKKNFA